MPEAIIFDMDGVLINSEKLKARAWKIVLEGYGVKNGDLWYRKRIGRSRNDISQDTISSFSLSVSVDELSKMKKETYQKLLEKQTEPVEPAIKFLKSISKANIKIGLASSSNRVIIMQQLQLIGASDYFDVIVSGEDDVEKNKPYPDIYLVAAKKLRVSPDQCVVIEDSTSGIEAAKRAGMKCVAYLNPDSGNQDLSKADMVIDDFSKIRIQQLLQSIS